MTRHKKVKLAVMGASIAILLVLEINGHFYSLLLFAEPAVPLARDVNCKRFVSYKPFWREKVYALDLSKANDWLTYYYTGDQERLRASVQECNRRIEQQRRSLYY